MIRCYAVSCGDNPTTGFLYIEDNDILEKLMEGYSFILSSRIIERDSSRVDVPTIALTLSLPEENTACDVDVDACETGYTPTSYDIYDGFTKEQIDLISVIADYSFELGVRQGKKSG